MGLKTFGLPTQGVGHYPKFDTQDIGKEVVYWVEMQEAQNVVEGMCELP